MPSPRSLPRLPLALALLTASCAAGYGRPSPAWRGLIETTHTHHERAADQSGVTPGWVRVRDVTLAPRDENEFRAELVAGWKWGVAQGQLTGKAKASGPAQELHLDLGASWNRLGGAISVGKLVYALAYAGHQGAAWSGMSVGPTLSVAVTPWLALYGGASLLFSGKLELGRAQDNLWSHANPLETVYADGSGGAGWRALAGLDLPFLKMGLGTFDLRVEGMMVQSGKSTVAGQSMDVSGLGVLAEITFTYQP